MKDDRSASARNSTDCATSSGWPTRPNGVRRAKVPMASSTFPSGDRRLMPVLSIGVSMAPGSTAFTRTRGAHSMAVARVNATIAPLLAAYAAAKGDVATAWTDAMLTTAPPLASNSGYAAFIARKAPRTIRSHHLVPRLGVGFQCQRGSPDGGVVHQCVQAREVCKEGVRVVRRHSASPTSTWRKASSATPSLRSRTSMPATLQPFARNAAAVALPIPPPTPVMATVRVIGAPHPARG